MLQCRSCSQQANFYFKWDAAKEIYNLWPVQTCKLKLQKIFKKRTDILGLCGLQIHEFLKHVAQTMFDRTFETYTWYFGYVIKI